MAITDVRANIAKYESVKRKAVDYILEHANPDGSYGPVEDGFYFYRLPWTFLVAGETRAALGICRWVRENMLTDEGDFDRGLRKLTDAYAYRNATFIYGAHMARQYDLSVGCMPFLLTLQDPASGGFANDLTEDGPSDTMDVPYTVGSGLACIATGNMDAALKVYGYLGQPMGTAGRASGPPLLQHVAAHAAGGQGVPAGGAPLARGGRPGRGAAALDGRGHSVGVPLPPVPVGPQPRLHLARPAVHAVLDGEHGGPVRVRPGVQVGLGLVAALPGDRRPAVPRLDGAHGRLVHGHAVRGRELVRAASRATARCRARYTW